MISLIEDGEDPRAPRFLYLLLRERDEEENVNISHSRMPTYAEHLQFMLNKPYRARYLIEVDCELVGSVSATFSNEIGVHVRQPYRGYGYGKIAIQMLMASLKPLHALPGRRRGCWLANIHPANERSKRLFERLGFTLVQHTYALEEAPCHAKREANDP